MADDVPITAHVPEEEDAVMNAVLDPENPADIACKIVRIERVDNRLDIHVEFSYVEMGTLAWNVVPDTIHVHATDINPAMIDEAIEARVEMYIRPKYLSPSIQVAPEVAEMIGTVRAL